MTVAARRTAERKMWAQPGGNPSPVLQPGKQVLHLMALLVQPLAVRDPLGAVPPGRDAGRHPLLQHQGANLVAVVPFVSNQHACLRKVLQQELSTGEVAALPFAEEKADRSSLPVAQHMGLAGEATATQVQSGEARRPLFQAGGGAVSFDAGGIDHQHPFRLHTSFWRCVGFCLSAGGAGQLGEDQLDNALLRPAAAAVGEDFVRSTGGWGIHESAGQRRARR